MLFCRRKYFCRNVQGIDKKNAPIAYNKSKTLAASGSSLPVSAAGSDIVLRLEGGTTLRIRKEDALLPPPDINDYGTFVAAPSMRPAPPPADTRMFISPTGGAISIVAPKAQTSVHAAPAVHSTRQSTSRMAMQGSVPRTSAQTSPYYEKQRDTTFMLLLLFCFIGAVVSGYLFYRSFYHIAASSAKPVAYVSVKNRVAQRKFLDRMSWDRISKNSAIYNGDTIHTGELSDVTVRFIDGTVIELYDNTMVQVFFNEKGEKSADLTAGSATVDASEAKTDSDSGFKLASGDVAVTVAAGSSVAASKSDSEGGVDTLQVVKGNAQVVTSSGEVQSLEAGDVAIGEGSGDEKRISIVVTSPLPNAKLMYYNEGTYTADFAWQCSADGSIHPADGVATTNRGTMVTLEVAEDKNYKKIINRIETDTNAAQVQLEPTRYYWRIRAKSDDSESKAPWVEGKMTVVQSLPPKTVTPKDGTQYAYRTKEPVIRLIWTESTSATEYRVSVSNNADMSAPIIEQSTQLTSFMLPQAVEGDYYWQVAAYMNGTLLGHPSAVASFTVKKLLTLAAPQLYMPQDRSAVNIAQDAKAAGKSSRAKVDFTWKSDSEAASYRIMVYADEKQKSVVIDDKVDANIYSASVRLFAPDTEYWWCVSAVDSEGGESPKSAMRSFTALDGDVRQELLSPPNGYIVEDTLLRGMKFEWQKNVPRGMTTHFEIAKDEDFSDIVYGATESGLSTEDVPLRAGSYYWRLRTEDEAGGENAFRLGSAIRRLAVVPPLPAAAVVSPAGRAVATWKAPYRFTWKAIDGAQFYRISILDKATGEVVYSSTVSAPLDDIDLYNDKNFKHRALYRYQIQGRADAKNGVASARSGVNSAGDFMFVRLQPVTILDPKDGDTLDGIDTFLNGILVRYASVDPLDHAEVVLSSIRDDDSMVLISKETMENPLRINTEDGIKSGIYEVAINAATTDGLDVSSALNSRTRFSVLPIPPLSAAESFNVSPSIVDAAYIKNNGTQLTLSWQDVKDATDYDVEITTGSQEVVKARIVQDASDGQMHYVLDIMALDDDKKALFESGDFECTVTPYRMAGNIVVQTGDAATAQFRSVISAPEKDITLDAVNPYALKKKASAKEER